MIKTGRLDGPTLKDVSISHEFIIVKSDRLSPTWIYDSATDLWHQAGEKPMTRETRTFINFADIVGIEFLCPHCQATTIHKVADGFNVPHLCPNCRDNWMADGSTDATGIKEFVRGLAKARGLSAPLRMRLEIKEE